MKILVGSVEKLFRIVVGLLQGIPERVYSMSANLADPAGWQPASRVRLGSLTSVSGGCDCKFFNGFVSK
jgi:hypothetical protein